MNKKFVLIILVILVLCSGAAYWLWALTGRITSFSAVVEGNLTVVSVSVPGVVKDVYVNAGDIVSRDQPLLALDQSGYESRLVRERDRLAEIASQLPPDLLVADPNSSPAPTGKPLEALRGEEEEARKKLETASHIHAAANLALSRLNAEKPGEYAQSSPSRQAALIARDEAEIVLKNARDAYEKASYARARREAQDRLKNSGDHLSAALAARVAEYEGQISRVRIAEQNLAATVVTAPEKGRVAMLDVHRGSEVSPGDASIALMPDEGLELWVRAIFSTENMAGISVGQDCEVRLDKGEESFKGKVGFIFDSEGVEKNVAVRVILDQDTLPKGLAVGQAVSVSIPSGKIGIGQALGSILQGKL